MASFLHRRKMTGALLLWSAYIATWTALTGAGPAIVTLWWFAGTIVFGLLWLSTQPRFQQGRGLGGLFRKPAWGQLRVVDLHRAHAATEPRRDAD
jgi:hypothetical protein